MTRLHALFSLYLCSLKYLIILIEIKIKYQYHSNNDDPKMTTTTARKKKKTRTKKKEVLGTIFDVTATWLKHVVQYAVSDADSEQITFR